MDALELAILALRLVLVALLYVFLFAVMRLAARGLRTVPARSPSGSLQLVVVEAGGSSLAPGQVIEVADGQTLGRAAPSQVRLPDLAVSSEHARLSRVGHAWMVTDLGSTNGTRVNEVAVQRQTPVHDGDVLALGNVRLKVVTR